MPVWHRLRNVLIVLAGVLFLVAWNRGVALLYGMFALVVATVGIAWVAPILMLRGVQVRRSAPEKVYEGEPLPLTLEICHASRRRRYMLEVQDRVPCAPPAAQTPLAFFPQVHTTQRLTLEVPCEQRGVYTLGPVSVHTGYPLGIGIYGRQLPHTTQTVVVYPRPFPVRHFTVSGVEALATSGVRAVAPWGTNEVFVGVRDYRHGDSRRAIHWPSSARHGKLIVKEYEGIATTPLILLLDLHSRANYGQGKHSTLEYAVKITASLAQYAVTHGYPVGVFGFGDPPLELLPATGPGQMQAILESLARVQANGTLPYAEAIGRTQARLRAGSLLVLFHHPLPEASAALPPALSRLPRSVRPVWMHFYTASFLASTSFPPPLPSSRRSSRYVIRRGDDLARMFAA